MKMQLLQGLLLLSLAAVAQSRALAKGGKGGMKRRKYQKRFSVLQPPPRGVVFPDPSDPNFNVVGLTSVINEDITDPYTDEVVGKGRGDCFQIEVGCWYRCTITYEFSAYDSVTVNGQFTQPANGTAAVGGGTGKYKGVTGEVDFYNLDGGFILLEFDLK